MTALLFRCVFMYVVVILAVRLMGKRQIGELQPAELVITILISEMASLPMQELHLPVIYSVLPIFALVALEILISVITLKSVNFRSFLYGHPVILIYRGQFRQKAMERARVTIDDIMEAMRNNGIADILTVEYAILETNGQLSVIEKTTTGDETGLPYLIIMDGKLLLRNMTKCGINKKWVYAQISQQNLRSPKQIFLMTVNDKKEVYLVKKQ